MAVMVAPSLMGMMEEPKKAVHPFFMKSAKPRQQDPEKDAAPTLTMSSSDELASDSLSKSVNRRGKRTTTKKSAKTEKDSKKSSTFAMLEVDPNNGRRKRVKTTLNGEKLNEEDAQAAGLTGPNQAVEGQEPQVISEHQTDEQTSQIHDDVEPRLAVLNPARKQEPGMSKPSISAAPKEEGEDPKIAMLEQKGGSSNSIAAAAEPSTTKPSKTLRLNSKTGTLASPPAEKSGQSASSTVTEKPPKPRSRKPRSHILIIGYGTNQESRSRIGAIIDRMLKSTNEAVPEQTLQVLSQSSGPSKTGKETHPFFSGKAIVKAQKPTHPFFSGKADPRPATLDKVADILPVSPRPKVSMVSARGRPSNDVKSTTAFAGFGKTERLFKFPGAMEPAWPWQGTVHIRGHKQNIAMPTSQEPSLLPKARKSKGQAVEVLLHEDVINKLAKDLCIHDIVTCLEELDLDDFSLPPTCLRLPKKHFETGRDLQRRVRKEIHAKVNLTDKSIRDESSSEDEIQNERPLRTHIHPALTKMYSSIAKTLSPFDQSHCETQAWVSKYSPKSAAEVLQIGREALILKEWLQTLTVMAVETGADNSRSRATSVISRRSATSKVTGPGKRKRKSKKLEGFIVSSDEEDNDMDEVSDPEDFDNAQQNQGLLKKTVIRAGDATWKCSKDSGKFSNAVVISGPHGCGKTAAAYAVAKELGFEVFELNSSSRRNGKDILEKVGDMTRNHLVQRLQKQVETDLGDDDMRIISDALAEDLNSGRQGTMKSFFKPKDPAKSKPAPKKVDNASEGTLPKAESKQKQSLVLLEEVDVIYEEDKQFWATVMTLIAQSKRPVIMTCTDETALPLHLLQLHAIIRFASAPTDLAVDYMLLLAANEGHALRREAVKALYQSRNFDLRASLMELDFWCQFTVGDCKGGLEWFYPRWPPGSDVDDHGETIRVVSEGTYLTGMGWLCQDFLESHSHYLDIEEETLHEVWDGWNFDLGDWQKNLDMSTWAIKLQSQPSEKTDKRAALSMYDDFAEAMSSADLCSGSTMASDNDLLLDTSLPEMPIKTREDYVIGCGQLLEASTLVVYDNLGMDISLWMKSRARKNLQFDQHIKQGWEVPAELERPGEAQIVDLVRNKSTSVGSSLARHDFSLAFDPISEPEKNSGSAVSLEPSNFDRTMAVIATDIAPYVRSIVAYDARLQKDRARLSNLLSEGGRKSKRLRTTRSAMSALEGGARGTTRRDRYFGPNLNPQFVFKTGLQSWQDAVTMEMSGLEAVNRRDGDEVVEESAEMDNFSENTA